MGCKFEERVAEALEAAVEAVRGARSALTSAGFTALRASWALSAQGAQWACEFPPVFDLGAVPSVQPALAKSIAINTTTASKAKQYKDY